MRFGAGSAGTTDSGQRTGSPVADLLTRFEEAAARLHSSPLPAHSPAAALAHLYGGGAGRAQETPGRGSSGSEALQGTSLLWRVSPSREASPLRSLSTDSLVAAFRARLWGEVEATPPHGSLDRYRATNSDEELSPSVGGDEVEDRRFQSAVLTGIRPHLLEDSADLQNSHRKTGIANSVFESESRRSPAADRRRESRRSRSPVSRRAASPRREAPAEDLRAALEAAAAAAADGASAPVTAAAADTSLKATASEGSLLKGAAAVDAVADALAAAVFEGAWASRPYDPSKYGAICSAREEVPRSPLITRTPLQERSEPNDGAIGFGGSQPKCGEQSSENDIDCCKLGKEHAAKAEDDLGSMLDSLEMQSALFQDHLRECARLIFERRAPRSGPSDAGPVASLPLRGAAVGGLRAGPHGSRLL